jgi:hypothetical protein
VQRAYLRAGGLAVGPRIETIVTGATGAITEALAEVVRTHEQAARGQPFDVMSLELNPAPSSPDGPAAPGVATRFVLGSEYAHGTLTEEELTTLASIVLRPEGRLALVRFASHHSPGTCQLGAAAAWTPEIALGEALTRQLLRKAAAHGTSDSWIRTPRALSHLWLGRLKELEVRLRAPLEHAADHLLGRLDTDFRDAPVSELDLDAARDRSRGEETISSWLDQMIRSIQEELSQHIAEPGGLRLVLDLVADGIDELAGTRKRLAARADSLGRQCGLLKGALGREDELRLDPLRRGPFFARGILARVRRRRTRRRLRAFLRVRQEELTVKGQDEALHALVEHLEAIHAQVLSVQARAARTSSSTLEDILTPSHPNQLAIHDTETLELFLDKQLDLLSSIGESPVVQGVWKGSAKRLLEATHPATTADPWSIVEGAARVLTSALPESSLPLGGACRGLIPRFARETLFSHLARLARPLPARADGLPRVELVVIPEESGPPRDKKPGVLPVVLHFSWCAPNG